MDVKVAAIYLPEIHVAEPAKNRENLEIALRECLENNPGIDLAVAPELANTGFHLVEYEYWRRFGEHKGSWEIKQSAEGRAFVEYISNNILPNYLEQIPAGATTKLLENLAKEFNTHIVCGLGEIDENGTRYNSAVFLDPEGYVGTYRQHKEMAGVIIPWTTGYGDKHQRNIFMIKKNKAKAGILICAEMAIQEIADEIVPTVSIVAVPANWYENFENSLDNQLRLFDHRYGVPLVMGNRGKELFHGEPHRYRYANPEETTGACAIICIPGKKILKRPTTIVETISI